MPKKELYGLKWGEHMEPLAIEMEMCRLGGEVKRSDGSTVGNGMAWHWKRCQQWLWPESGGDDDLVRKKWHRWNELQSECYCKYRTLVVIGAASTGKTNSAATDALLDYYLQPSCTTIIICSTTRERLEDRVWGEIKKYHKAARARFPWLPGNLIEGRLRLVTDDKTKAAEGRDFRNGVIGVPCKRGDSFVGIGDFAGIKNKRVRLIGDELSLLPRAFVDAISNLDKNPDFKCVGLGNPKETTDALGVLGEPASEHGGWDGGIDQAPVTKTWKIRRPEGICLQLVGSDSPNLDGQLGIPLITQEQIDRDVAFYGKDSVWFTMMNQGMMPRGQGSHRVLTRQMCEKFHAFDEPLWRDSNIKKIAFMDAGYGGDRCIFGELNFGRIAEGELGQVAQVGSLASSEQAVVYNRQILSIVDTTVVPISSDKDADLPEDQIVHFVSKELAKRAIPLTDFFYEPGQRTKLTVAFSRITGEIGNPVDCLGKPTERPIALGVDVKCVDHFSKYVTELWFSVRLAVEASQFRRLPQDALMEFCAREWGYVAGNKIEVETKTRMKEKTGRSPDCFVAGTMVRLADGLRRIEDVGISDEVVTPFGLARVIAIHCHDVDTLTAVDFSDGSALIGKGSHRVFTWDAGLVRLDDLSIANEVESSNNFGLWENLSRWFTRATHTTFKALAGTTKTVGMMSPSDFYTELYGLSTMAQFLKALKCITKTIIGEIIKSETWNLGRVASIVASIPLNDSRMTQSFSNVGGPLGLQRLQLGIALRKDGYGTLNTQRLHGRSEPQCQFRAESAGLSSTHSERTKPFTALIHAAPKPKGSGFGLLALVRSAAKALTFIGLKPRSIAAVSVRQLQLPEKRRVYDITLDAHNVYYANGVLVENCADAIAIGLEGARQRGFNIVKVGRAVPNRAPSDRWKRELRDKAHQQWHAGDLAYEGA